MFAESHTICRPASCCWYVWSWADGLRTGGQVKYRQLQPGEALLHSYLLIETPPGHYTSEMTWWRKGTVLKNYFSFPKAHLKNILWHHQVKCWTELLETLATTVYTFIRCMNTGLFNSVMILFFYFSQETFPYQQGTRGPLYWNTQSSNVHKCILDIYFIPLCFKIKTKIKWM